MALRMPQDTCLDFACLLVRNFTGTRRGIKIFCRGQDANGSWGGSAAALGHSDSAVIRFIFI